MNLKILQQQLKRELETIPARDYVALFKDWAPGVFSPFAGDYGIKTIIDEQLARQDVIYLPTGTTGEYIRVNNDDFRMLHSTALFGHSFSSPISVQATEVPVKVNKNAKPAPPPVKEPSSTQAIYSLPNIKEQIEKITELPLMPQIAQKIIHLNANPYARAQDLAQLIEVDPSLASQIIRYACSPFFGYRGTIDSVQDAISRVLGYDMVMNIALGIAVAKPFKNPMEGPIGLKNFWRHATYSGALTQLLGNLLPKNLRPRPGISYLSGLLHNFGFLLLGHLFIKEFSALNKAIIENPEVPIIEHEEKLLGVSHSEIGAWLMQAWNMPAEIIVVLREHHNSDYDGLHAVYANLVLLGDRLLKRYDIGDASSSELPQDILLKLGLKENILESTLEKFLQAQEDLEFMAKTLAA